jgi:hypothetical protein
MFLLLKTRGIIVIFSRDSGRIFIYIMKFGSRNELCFLTRNLVHSTGRVKLQPVPWLHLLRLDNGEMSFDY